MIFVDGYFNPLVSLLVLMGISTFTSKEFKSFFAGYLADWQWLGGVIDQQKNRGPDLAGCGWVSWLGEKNDSTRPQRFDDGNWIGQVIRKWPDNI